MALLDTISRHLSIPPRATATATSLSHLPSILANTLDRHLSTPTADHSSRPEEDLPQVTATDRATDMATTDPHVEDLLRQAEATTVEVHLAATTRTTMVNTKEGGCVCGVTDERRKKNEIKRQNARDGQGVDE